MPNRAVIGVGSNIAADENVAAARALLEAHCRILDASPFVETAPLGIADQPPFLNGAWLVETAHARDALRAELKRIEDRCGRDRSVPRHGPRTIDLDVVVWNGKIVDSDVFERDFLRDAVQTLWPSALETHD